MYKVIASALLLLVSFSSFSQTLKYCGTTEKEAEIRAANPSIYADEAALKEFVKEWIANHPGDLRDGATFIIPIVFHVIHDYGVENISDDQVRDAVQILNEDYRKLNADTVNIVSSFKSVAADAKIEFRLANIAPDGSCTTGIEHIHSLQTNVGNDGSKLSDWPRDKYLNVWTVKDMEDGVAGYAYLPSDVNQSSDAPYDGVMILSNYVGSIGTGSSSTSRALTHEIGHTMNLNHTWGQTNSPGVECGDDDVDDTPETKGWTSCNLSGSICHPPIIENVQNYMEYAYCSNMFTKGQSDLMGAVLNAPTAKRNNLWKSSNLTATGTSDTTRDLCAPIADFYSNPKMACVGSAVTFNDASWNGEADTYSWDFGDGLVSSEQNPVVTYSVPGWKTVKLTASNSEGSNTVTRSKYIYISVDSAQYIVSGTAGYSESFESSSTFDNDWIVVNQEGNSSKWTRANVGYNSSNSAHLNNFNNMEGDIDVLISPSIDLSVGGPQYLNFRYTCAAANGQHGDFLKVYSSSNCGQTWLLRTTVSGDALVNAGNKSQVYVPNGSSTWTLKSIVLPGSIYLPNIRFKFEYKTDGNGNDIYMDDINVTQWPVGVHDPSALSFNLSVVPNPVDASSVAVVTNNLSGNMTLRIVDLQGRIVKDIYSGYLSEGQHQFFLHADELNASGMYFLVADDGITITREKIVTSR